MNFTSKQLLLLLYHLLVLLNSRLFVYSFFFLLIIMPTCCLSPYLLTEPRDAHTRLIYPLQVCVVLVLTLGGFKVYHHVFELYVVNLQKSTGQSYVKYLFIFFHIKLFILYRISMLYNYVCGPNIII